jgi:hypothetical protein
LQQKRLSDPGHDEITAQQVPNAQLFMNRCTRVCKKFLPTSPPPHEEEREEDTGRRVLIEALEDNPAQALSDVHTV